MFVSKKRKQILLAVTLPLLVISALYLKNFVLFGSFTTSRAWMAFNLLEMSAKNLSNEAIEQFFREGKIKTYDPYMADKTGVAVLDQVIKPSSGELNWHSQQSLINAEVDLQNAFYFLKNYPRFYLDSLNRAYRMYFFPGPTDVTFPNRRSIELYENIYNFMYWHLNAINHHKLYSEKLLLWYKFDTIQWDDLSLNLYSSLVVFYILLFLAGLILIFRGAEKSDSKLAFRLTMFFMVMNIFYISVGSNFFAWIGSNRYRFVVEPYYLTILALGLNRVLGWTRTRGAKTEIE